MATEVIHFVDPNSSAGGTGNTNALSGADRAFVSLSAAEAALQADIVTADEVHRIICSSDDAGSTHAADTTAVVIDGWTTDATRYIQIEAASSHGGKWNDNIYRLNTDYQPITLLESYIKVVVLQIKQTDTADWNSDCINFGSGIGGITISRCIITSLKSNTVGADSGTGLIGCIYSNFGSVPIYIYNNILYDKGGTYGTAIAILSYLGDWRIYNNSISGCAIGINSAASTYPVISTKNNLIYATDAYYGTFDDNDEINNYNSISENNSSEVAIGTNGRYNQTFTFVDAVNKDFHLASTDAGARDYGVSDPGSGLFTDDIDGQTRTGTWDIGADEYVAAGGSVTGTATASITESDVVAGGKVLTITLTGDTFIPQ